MKLDMATKGKHEGSNSYFDSFTYFLSIGKQPEHFPTIFSNLILVLPWYCFDNSFSFDTSFKKLIDLLVMEF
jgi:hypothetical protein